MAGRQFRMDTRPRLRADGDCSRLVGLDNRLNHAASIVDAREEHLVHDAGSSDPGTTTRSAARILLTLGETRS